MKKFVGLLKNLGITAIPIAIILLYYAFSIWTGGSLTTADSCSGLYIRGDIDIAGVKRHCPSLSKDSLKESVEAFFKETDGTAAFTSETVMLKQIEDDF